LDESVDPLLNSTKSEASSSVAIILIASVIGFYMIFLVKAKSFVFGSVSGRWVYEYFESTPTIPLWIPILIGILLGLSIFVGSKFIHTQEKATLLACFLSIFIIQVLIYSVYPISLGKIVLSNGATSFYSPAMEYSVFEILNNFTELAPTLPRHARTNMPGKILLFEVFTIFTKSPEIMGILIIGISSLGALLLYGICKQLFRDRQAAFYAFILYGLIPSKTFFLPILNTVTPIFILLCLYLLIIYIRALC